ncbi:MAG: hypothetical protein JEY71_07270 [Sphaerochaeta sp.]|nr:hypothetical protein [Sphaerochaeta sp.]
MSRVRKRVVLALVVALVLSSVAAEDSVFIGDGDIGSIRMYDSQGVALEATVEVASNIGEGWIIYNPDSPILIITPKGSINLYEDSILITGDLISNNPSLYLVKGKATFNTYDMKGGTLSVATPVSLFKLTDDGEMLVITDDVEESATVFKGEATSYNSITRATRTIGKFQKLRMQESQAKPKPVAAGYYLTYATYPDLMLAKQLISEMATEKIETPSVPKFSSILQKPQKAEPPVMRQGVIIMPAKAPSFASVEVAETAKPPIPYRISVTSEPVKVPSIPQSLLISSIIPRPVDRIIITVQAMPPKIPSLVNVMTEVEPEVITSIAKPSLITSVVPIVAVIKAVQPEAIEDQPATTEPEAVVAEAVIKAVQPEAPEAIQDQPATTEPEAVVAEAVIEPVQPEAPEAIEEQPATTEPEAVVAEAVIEPVQPEAIEDQPATTKPAETTLKQEKPLGIMFTQEEDRKTGSIGLQTSYSFLFDGTDSNTMLHTLTLRPYVTYKSFALTLQSSVSTEDFSSFSSNVTTLPAGNLETLAYGFNFISSARVGYATAPFFLALDNNQYHGALTDQYYAPRFDESLKLGLYNRIEMGPFSSTLYFDDLYLANLLATPSTHQFSSFSLEYAKEEGYRFSVSLGTLAKIKQSEVNLYPNITFLFPLIDIRTTQLSLLVSASGYLPAYPTFEFDQFLDLGLTSLFPNYQMSAGLSLKQGPFSAKVLGSLRKGENRNLLTSELLDVTISTASYNSIFDIFAETGFAGEHFDAHLTVNLPFASDLTLADGVGSYKADFTQLTLSYKQKAFTFSLGLQEVGIGQTISDIADGSKNLLSLFGGSRSTSFLAVGFTKGDLSIKAKAAYPISATEYTTPKITITASYKLGMQF